MPQSQIDKEHPHREVKTLNNLSIMLRCPYNEAILDDNRMESALRAATGVPDLEVRCMSFEIVGD